MAQTNPFRIGDWLPFWSSLILFGLGWFTVVTGGYSFLLVIAVVWYVVPILDQIMNKAKAMLILKQGKHLAICPNHQNLADFSIHPDFCWAMDR